MDTEVELTQASTMLDYTYLLSSPAVTISYPAFQGGFASSFINSMDFSVCGSISETVYYNGVTTQVT